jgi:hypothetical protein
MGGIKGVKDEKKHKTEEYKKNVSRRTGLLKEQKHRRNMGRIKGVQNNTKTKTQIQD